MSIHLRHAAACYQAPDGEVEAVRDVSFDLEEGEFISLVGPSGCGKSTLLRAIAGLESLSGGTIDFGGASRVGYMPQRDELFPWRTIEGNVTLGLRLRREKDENAYRHVHELLERYGLAAFAGKKPAQLSGGMRQRCALIRTLATDPDTLLLDEPFSALDYQTRLNVSADIWQIIRQEGNTALLVTHDIAEAVSMSDRVVVLSPRPAVVKAVVDIGALNALPPMARRDTPQFHRFFNAIWKELDVHG